MFALANATELVHGYDPARCQWETGEMRMHLTECFEKGYMATVSYSEATMTTLV